MMRKRTLLAAFLFWAFALSCAVLSGWLFFEFSCTAIPLATENRTVIIAIITTFILGPLWVGYGRVSVLDKAEGYSDTERAAIRAYASETRKNLLAKLPGVFLVVVAALGIFSAGTKMPYARDVFTLFVPVLVLYLLWAIRKISTALIVIESSISDATQKQIKQVSRQKLIDALKKSRAEAPIKSDEHLEKYRTIVQ